MALYLIKSTAILAILLLFYKLFLEKENMHLFKRTYLLGSLIVSFAIPFITFVEYVEIPAVVQGIEQSNDPIIVYSSTEQEQNPIDYLPFILWSIYGIGSAVFGFRFIKNLSQIILKIRKNPKFKINRITNVLLCENTIPHTFFNYIFLNRQKFEAKQIPQEVLLHEETHAKQKHSLDVLLIEFVQVLFWFNPLIYPLKKAIKLNHEFLADKAVIQGGIQPTLYQNLLLEFSSNPRHPALANAINYSSIKKRFTVMKTRTSKKAIVLRSLFLMPLLAMILYGFSEKKIVETPTTSKTNDSFIEQSIPTEIIEIGITKNGKIHIKDGTLISLENLKSYLLNLNTHLTKDQRSNIVRAQIKPSVDAPLDLLADIEAILVDYGVAQVNIIGPEEYADLNLQTIDQKGATKSQIKEYNALAIKYNRQLSKEKSIQIFKSDVERLEYLHGLMSLEQRENAEPFPDFPEPPPVPEAPEVKEGEVSNIPPPPPPAPMVRKGEKSDIPAPPKAPKAKKGKKNDIPPPPSVSNLSEVEIANKVIDEIIAHQDPYDVVGPMRIQFLKGEVGTISPTSPGELKIVNELKEIREEIKSVKSIKDEVETNQVKPPPPPKSPLDHVIEMAKKDATFYYEGKEISSDKAIAILKENRNMNIRTKHKGLKTPIVELSTKPIVIKK